MEKTARLPISAGSQASHAESFSTEELLSRIAKPEESLGIAITKIQVSAIGFPPGEWESLGFHAAVQKSNYAFFLADEKLLEILL